MRKATTTVRTEAIANTLDHLRALGAQGQPIVCGPWLSEIGFELLYWIPFLRWGMAAADLRPEQLVILSRGGCASWYGDLTSNYVELYDTFTPEDLRALNVRRVREQATDGDVHYVRRGQVTAKQYGIGAVDREIIERVGLGHAALLHPSVMYALFKLYWRRRVLDLYDRCARLTKMTVPERLIQGRYTAVKFYSSEACRQTDGTREQVTRIVKTLAKSTRVVLLDSGDAYDEHGAFPIEDEPRVVRVPLTPQTNLATQTAIIGHAQAFVGTYGGFAYLAPLLGVPTTALYAQRNFREDHLQLASQRFSKFRVRFDVMDLTAGVQRVGPDVKRWTHAA
jgi:hypothetical protein